MSLPKTVTRRRITRARFKEISGVDFPAQTPATADLVKNQTRVVLDQRAYDSNHQPTETNAMSTTATPDAGQNTAILKRAETAEQLAAANEARAVKAEGEATGLRDQLAKAMALGTLSDEQRRFYATLGDAEGKDFLAKSSADRETFRKGRVVHTSINGACYYLGEDQRLVDNAKETDALKKRAETAEAAHATAEFAKAAGELCGSLPDPDNIAAEVVAAIHKSFTDEKKRTAALALIGAGNEAQKMLATAIGRGINPALNKAGGPEAELHTMALEIQKAAGGATKMSYELAYDEAIQSPKGATLYDKAEQIRKAGAPASN